MSLGRLRIKSQRLFRGQSSLWHGLRRIEKAIVGEQTVRVGKAGMGDGARIVLGDGLLETGDALEKPLAGSLIGLEASLKTQVVAFQVRGIPGRAGFALPSQRKLKGIDDGS